MEACDVDVFEVWPIRRLIAEAVRQVVELQSHRVVFVFFKCDPANCLRHGAPPLILFVPPKNCRLYRISIMRYRERKLACFMRCTRGKRMVKKIALEEHFLCPDFIEYWYPTVVDLPAERRDKELARLTDFGEFRLAGMDEGGLGPAGHWLGGARGRA